MLWALPARAFEHVRFAKNVSTAYPRNNGVPRLWTLLLNELCDFGSVTTSVPVVLDRSRSFAFNLCFPMCYELAISLISPPGFSELNLTPRFCSHAGI